MSDATIRHIQRSVEESTRRLSLDTNENTREELLEVNKRLLRVIAELTAVVQQQQKLILQHGRTRQPMPGVPHQRPPTDPQV